MLSAGRSSSRRRIRSAIVIPSLFVCLLLVIVSAATTAAATSTSRASAASALPANVKVYWSKTNRVTGAVSSFGGSTTIYSESTVKIWLAADFFRRVKAQNRTPTAWEYEQLRRMIVFSDDWAGEYFYRQNGSDATISRMITTCKLTDTKVYQAWWSKTAISARDLVKLGVCVVEGRTGASAYHTGLLTYWMRNIGGDSLFGIEWALPPREAVQVAAKNGWFNHTSDGRWRVLCLGVHPKWALAVLTYYPNTYGRGYGEKLCETVTERVLGWTGRQHPPSVPIPPRKL